MGDCLQKYPNPINLPIHIRTPKNPCGFCGTGVYLDAKEYRKTRPYKVCHWDRQTQTIHHNHGAIQMQHVNVCSQAPGPGA